MKPWSKWALGLGLLAVVPFTVAAVRAYLRHDPFGYYGKDWAEPFGGDVGSVMSDVQATVFEGGEKKVTFDADKVEVRRDKQFMQLFGVNEGKVFDQGVEQASFSAGQANFDGAKRLLHILGIAKVSGEDFDLQAKNPSVDLEKKQVDMPEGVVGSAFKGQVKADKLELGFGQKSHRALNVEWRGAPPVQGVTQSREVQFRAEDTQITSNPDVVVFSNAEAIDEHALMRAKKVTWDRAADVITLEGGAEYYGPEAILSAPKVVVHRKVKRVVATGGVYLLAKPEGEKGVPVLDQKQPAQPELPPGLAQPTEADTDDLRSAKNLRKYPVVVTSATAEYFYAKGSKKAILTGEPRALQQLRSGVWREVTAPRAEYEEEKETLSLFASEGEKNVRMKNSAGDDFIASFVRLGTTEGSETLNARGLEGVMKARDDEIPRVGSGGG